MFQPHLAVHLQLTACLSVCFSPSVASPGCSPILTNRLSVCLFQPKCRLTELFTCVAEQMCLQGMQDPDLFGLAVVLGKCPPVHLFSVR